MYFADLRDQRHENEVTESFRKQQREREKEEKLFQFVRHADMKD